MKNYAFLNVNYVQGISSLPTRCVLYRPVRVMHYRLTYYKCPYKILSGTNMYIHYKMYNIMYIQSQHKFDKQPRGIHIKLVFRRICRQSLHWSHYNYYCTLQKFNLKNI